MITKARGDIGEWIQYYFCSLPRGDNLDNICRVMQVNDQSYHDMGVQVFMIQCWTTIAINHDKHIEISM